MCKNLTRRNCKRKGYIKTPYCKLKKIWNPTCSNCEDKEYKVYKPIKKVSKKRITVSKTTYNQVFQECDGKCVLCGTTETLQYHHIKYRSEAKHLIDEPKNGIMLCVKCHKLVHSNKRLWQPKLLEIKGE